jgi:hypothetical protein
MGDLIIFDRYFYDWFIQTQFKRAPGWLFHVFTRLFPRPDLVVHLQNDAGTVHARKPELSVAEIEEQNRKCRRIVDSLQHAMTVETDLPVDQVIEQIQEGVVALMKSRFRQRNS